MGERTTHWEGEPLTVWEAVWDVPAVEAWKTIGSTNDRARALAGTGASPFTVVIAEEQTAGRGREGRRWSSPPGAGLWMSVVLPPAVDEAHRLVPLLTGIAVCRAVEGVAIGVSARLKWPNDVLVHGRKVCGILCEGSGGSVVVGIGVNVRQSPADFPGDVRRSADSLEHASGARVSRSALAGSILGGMRDLLERPVLRLEGELADEVLRRDALRGRRVSVGGRRGGVVRGVGPTGALLVEDEGVVRPVVAGTVRVVEGEPDGG